MRILITGGLGFIGSHLANHYLQDLNNEVIIVDNLSTGRICNVDISKPNLKIILFDINSLCPELNAKLLLDEFKKGIDYVYHYSACVGVDRTLKNPELVLSDMIGTETIISLSNKYNVKKFIFASSSEVYGEISSSSANENYDICYNTPYMIAKRFGEKICLDYEYDNMETYVLRFFNVYGKNQSSDFVVSKLFNKVLKRDSSFLIYGDRFSVRDYVYIDDNINATIFIVENGKPNNIYNICSGQRTTLHKLIKQVEQSINSLITDFKFYEIIIDKRNDIKERVGDNTKLKDLGFEFRYNLEEGLEKTWQEILKEEKK